MPDQPWLSVSQAAGTLAAAGTTMLTIVLDRQSAPDGALNGSLQLTALTEPSAATGPVTALTVAVNGTVDHPPLVAKPTTDVVQLTLGPCPPTTMTVSVTASDNAGLASVVLHWQLVQLVGGVYPHTVAQGTQQMTDPSGSGTYAAGVGPFDRTGQLTVWGTATDTAGHSTDSTAAQVPVVAGCIP